MMIGRWPTLRGLDGQPFELSKAITFDLFKEVVRSTPLKAVGVSGFALAMMRQAGRTEFDRDPHAHEWCMCMCM